MEEVRKSGRLRTVNHVECAEQMVIDGIATKWMVAGAEDATLETKQTWVGSKLSVLSVLCSPY